MIVIKLSSVSVTAYLSSNWNAPQLEILTSSVSAVVPPLSRAQPLTTTICPVSWVTPLSLMQEVPGNRPSLVTQMALLLYLLYIQTESQSLILLQVHIYFNV